MFRSPLFAWSPRPDQNQDFDATPATQSTSRFSAFRSNVRGMVNGSSIYSQSPAMNNNNNINTPKTPFLGFWNRQQPANQDGLPTHQNAHRESHVSRAPFHAHHTAGSYIGAINPPQDLQEPTTLYARHPADVPLPNQQEGFVDPEIQQLQDEINGRRHKRRKHRRRKHHRTERSASNASSGSNGWVRRREQRGTTAVYIRGSAARGKMIACVISGTFLITILAIYLAIALTNRSLGQEIHILFIMVLLTITIFFCHSLIRLCMLMLNPPRHEHRAAMPDMTGGGEGFQPIVPIRVHLRRDEESADADMDDVLENDMVGASGDEEGKNMPPPPPPAYGLWRSSVRVDPNLLHWQRVGDATRGSAVSAAAHSTRASLSGPAALAAASLRGSAASTSSHQPTQQEGPRPPSYASEDGVSYIVEAEPRHTTNVRDSTRGALNDIHPAWRPGYAMSEIRGGELPASAMNGSRS
ncbi:uncharacterized protein J4E78_008748 [Alternaria triticimaculans]|uniref:uncharacterized protein n=1 Tax=Alternaria triticimaculans TaxID=297637 RepID=UPI0020C4DAC5|nr:uncharacterized protein J4E78_008748 [Alternaria triticimaculans]KAI4648685.1 hypothetical protein J4E78_008748 [Alternaria triticimaculans]